MGFNRPTSFQQVYEIANKWCDHLQQHLNPFCSCTIFTAPAPGYTTKIFGSTFQQIPRPVHLCSKINWIVYIILNLFHVIWSSVSHARSPTFQAIMCWTKSTLWGFVCCQTSNRSNVVLPNLPILTSKLNYTIAGVSKAFNAFFHETLYQGWMSGSWESFEPPVLYS